MIMPDILVAFVKAMTSTASFLGHLKIGRCRETVLGVAVGSSRWGAVQFSVGSREAALTK